MQFLIFPYYIISMWHCCGSLELSEDTMKIPQLPTGKETDWVFGLPVSFDKMCKFKRYDMQDLEIKCDRKDTATTPRNSSVLLGNLLISLVDCTWLAISFSQVKSGNTKTHTQTDIHTIPNQRDHLLITLYSKWLTIKLFYINHTFTDQQDNRYLSKYWDWSHVLGM